jgi:dipeptidyl aminopeptidase/acylaminoacyl peptidase
MQVGAPHWSPVGNQIAFHGEMPGKGIKGYTVSVNGGLAEPVLAETQTGEEMLSWSADGSRIMYTEVSSSAAPRVRILNLSTHQIKDVPGSVGLTGAVWSPDGRYVAAENPASEMRLFDFQTGRWTSFASWGVNVTWSPDSKYLYFDTLNRYPRTPETIPGFFRYRIRDGLVEKLFGIPDFNVAGVWGIWVSVAPDGSPLVLKDSGTRDLYALELDFP